MTSKPLFLDQIFLNSYFFGVQPKSFSLNEVSLTSPADFSL